MLHPRILSDIDIWQSETWTKRSDFLDQPAPRPSGAQWHRALQRLLPARVRRLLTLLARCRHYDVIVTADVRLAQAFGIVRSLLRLRRPRHIVLELMLDEESPALRWRLKHRLQALAFAAVDRIFVSSSREVHIYARRLGLPPERLSFLPFHTNIREPTFLAGTGAHVLSAGRTGRDYQTLCRAIADTDCQLTIVTDAPSVKDLAVPANVTIQVDLPYPRYLELLRDAALVVVPLQPVVKSTGQVVLLEAMALGKPVIATLAVGTVDYIDSGIDGILVPAADPQTLRSAILGLLRDPGARTRLGLKALERVKRRHMLHHYVDAILQAATDITGAPPRP